MARAIMKASPLSRLERKFAVQYRECASAADKKNAPANSSEQEKMSKSMPQPSSQHARPAVNPDDTKSLMSREVNKPDIYISSYDSNEIDELEGKICSEEEDHQLLSPTRAHVEKAPRTLKVKTVQALHPPCQVEKVGRLPVHSYQGNIQSFTNSTIPSQTASSKPNQQHVTNKSQALRNSSPISSSASLDHSLTMLDRRIDSFISELSSALPTVGDIRSPLTLPQRLLTMDVHETMELLRDQGYSQTFIAEHLWARGYRVGPGGVEAVYRGHQEEWVRVYLEKVVEWKNEVQR